MATVFFLCDEQEATEIKKDVKQAMENISKGYFSLWDWSAGNVKKIQVGDRIYMQRVGQEPRGFFAAGLVVAADEDEQLRLRDVNYDSLSEAYTDVIETITDSGRVNRTYYVQFQVESIVDYDEPLERKTLERMSKFKGVNFVFYQGGCEFSSEHAPFLYAEWEKHSMELTRKGKGQRMVDVFVEKGKLYREEKEFELAIEAFDIALAIDPKYSKAINLKSLCEKLLSRASEKNTVSTNGDASDSIVSNELSDAIPSPVASQTNSSLNEPSNSQAGTSANQLDSSARGSTAERIGRAGEKLVNQYFSNLLKQRQIQSFHWVSSEKPTSPYDFSFVDRDDIEVLMDVKSTSGNFESPIYISLNELNFMVQAKQYDIDRIYALNEEQQTAKMRVARNVKGFAKNILGVLELLPKGASIDTVLVLPAQSELEFGEEIELKMK